MYNKKMKMRKIITILLLSAAFVFPIMAQTVERTVTMDENYRIIDWNIISETNNAIPQYMEFEIPLNPGGYPGNWTDFELKIYFVTNSTQEWTTNNLMYYYQTMGDPWDGNNTNYGDTNCNVYFVDEYNSQPRQWILYTNITSGIDINSIASQFKNVDTWLDSVIVYPSHEGCYVDWATWQTYTNTHNLRASYNRYDSVGPETNAAGGLRWQPLRINWIMQRKSEN